MSLRMTLLALELSFRFFRLARWLERYLFGWLIGVGLDKHFKTGWMEIAGVLLGAVAGFVQIIRTASRYLNRSGQ